MDHVQQVFARDLEPGDLVLIAGGRPCVVVTSYWFEGEMFMHLLGHNRRGRVQDGAYPVEPEGVAFRLIPPYPNEAVDG